MTDPEYRRDLARLETRLERIETVLVSIARMDERLITLFKRMDRYDGEQAAMARKLAELERVTIGRGVFFRWLDRGGVAALGAAVALWFKGWGG